MAKIKANNVAALSKSKSSAKKKQSLTEDNHSKKRPFNQHPKDSAKDKYKVGGIAALFTKPKSPSTDAGKKLQSLFEDYYSKKSTAVLFHEKEHKLTTDGEAVGLNDKNSLKKGKKRKFDHSELNVSSNKFEDSCDNLNTGKNKKFKNEQGFPRKKNNNPELDNNCSSTFMKSSQQEASYKVNENRNFKKFKKQQDFPRKKNKFSEIEENRSPLKFEGRSEQENGPKTDKKMKVKKLKKQQNSLIQGKQSNSFNISPTVPKFKVQNISEGNMEFPSVSKLKNMKKDNKLNKNFIKKSKKQSLNNKSDKLTNNAFIKESSGKDDLILRKELQEFMDDNSLKQKLEENVASFEPKKTIAQDSKRNPKKEKSYDQNVRSKKKKFKHNSDQQEFFRNEKSESKQFKSELNTNNNFVVSESNPETKISQDSKVVDFVRKPKNKKDGNDTFGKDYFKKSNAVAVKSLYAGTNLKNTEFVVDNASKISQNMEFKSDALDFIKLPKPSEENNEKSIQERLSRTLFVGNLPKTTRKREVKNLFSTFGKVEGVRLTGIETDKAKIFAKSSPKLLNSNYASDTIPGFVVFADKQSAVQALCLSGSVFKGHHITVDFALPAGSHKIYDEKRTIFIGNLGFDVKDESVWNAFNQCGKVEGVRVVRDRETGLGKGFGYVLFSTMEAKQNALGLENLSIEGREIRIQAANSNKTKKSNSSFIKRDTFKSRAIRLKNNAKVTSGRKSIRKLTNKQKMLHKKKKIASILQKAMK